MDKELKLCKECNGDCFNCESNDCPFREGYLNKEDF